MRKIIIAIDGYSGTGKSSTARRVSEEMGYTYIDSGAMYRAVTYYFLNNQVAFEDHKTLMEAIDQISIAFKSGKTFLNGDMVEDEIRSMQVNQHVSEVAALSPVRAKLVQLQQEMGKNKEVVMDGRDIGTVVFPQAELKVFMTADVDIRAERRRKQLMTAGVTEDFESIKQNFIKRDKIDASRQDSPLKKAADSIEIDTTHLTMDEQIAKIILLAKDLIHEN